MLRHLAIVILIVTGCGCMCSADDIVAPSPDAISTKIVLPVTPVLVEPDIRPVPQPNIEPRVIGTIGLDEWYVVESSVELIALQSPNGLLAIEASSGPIKVRGKFSDGTGKTETREYRSPYVYFVTAEKAGTTELILIPIGVMDAKEIVRQVLVVSGQGPQPPPDPDDPIVPDPPKPVESFRVIFVKESGSTLSAEQTAIPGAKAIRDYLTAKTTPEGGLSGWREYDPQQTTANEQPTMRALWLAALPKLRPPPCVVVEVNGKADIIDLPANVTDALKILKSYGGQ